MSTEAPSATSATTLLKLQLGPVQEFIAQARSTRDLWSGSYLLSWLMAAGAAALVRLLDGEHTAIVSPKVTNQPLFDLHMNPARARDEKHNDDLLTPNFTNILVAVVPKVNASDLAKAMVSAIHVEWEKIATACWRKIEEDGLVEVGASSRRKRYERQIKHFPSITWQLTSRPDDGRIEALLAGVPIDDRLRPKLVNARDDHGAPDFFPAQTVRNSWQLDAARQLREFPAWNAGGWTVDHSLPNEKDSFSGKEEAVIGGRDWWDLTIKPLAEKAEQAMRNGRPLEDFFWPILFREDQKDDWFGAMQLIKRLWHWAYLADDQYPWKLRSLHTREPLGKMFPFPSTPQIAIHDPAKNVREYLEDQFAEALKDAIAVKQEHTAYFSVLAMDGDSMGKWLGGEKTISGPTREFRSNLSTRLTNFALHCVRPIVEACDGRLIFAGGEDVLALLPADTALDCARFLRLAYRAEPEFIGPLADLATRLRKHHRAHEYREPSDRDERKPEMSAFLVAAAEGKLFQQSTTPGVLRFNSSASSGRPQFEDIRLPGGITDEHGARPEISAGVAIAHFKEPLQDVVQAAHRALNDHAKRNLGRAALAVTLVKHSGETVEWGCKWKSGGLDLLGEIQQAMAEDKLSARFPHRVIELLAPYLVSSGGALTSAPQFEKIADDVIHREFGHAVGRQHGPRWPNDPDRAEALRRRFEQALGTFLVGRTAENGRPDLLVARGNDDRPHDAQVRLRAVIGLCRIAAFIEPAAHWNKPAEENHRP